MIRANRYCIVPMSALVSGLYNLPLGRTIKVTVEALNLVGYSVPSTPNTSGATIRTEPQSPLSGPTRDNAGTTDTTIQVDYSVPTYP